MRQLSTLALCAATLAAGATGCASAETASPAAEAPPPAAAAPAEAPAPPTPDQEFLERLKTEKTSFAFDGQSLPEALLFLAARHGIEVVYDAGAREIADGVVLPSLKRLDVPLAAALDELVGPDVGLAWEVKDKAVHVRRK